MTRDTHTPESQYPSHSSTLSRGKKVAIIALLAGLLFVVLVLPALINEPWLIDAEQTSELSDSGSLSQQISSQQGTSKLAPSKQAELKLLRRKAQDSIAKAQKLKHALKDMGADQWGSQQFMRAEQSITEGDSRYTQGRYDLALSAYQQAHETLKTLNIQSKTALKNALEKGISAIESRDLKTATENIATAKQIAPKTLSVSQATSRLESLPVVITALQNADKALSENLLEQAKQHFSEAVDADRNHQYASQQLKKIQQLIIDNNFQSAMSQGYRALASNQFDAASAAFKQAKKIQPNNPQATQALSQVANQQTQTEANQELARAKSLEQREQWRDALTVYQNLLSNDASLTQAAVRVVPVKTRAQLDEKIEKTLAKPLLLSSQKNFQAAQQLLVDAQSIRQQGQRLKNQIAALDKLLVRARTPIDVTFLSDGKTDVSVYRVAKLGKFTSDALTLRPGNYVVAGTREGYRDVVIKFTVLGEPLEKPIVIQCIEQI